MTVPVLLGERYPDLGHSTQIDPRDLPHQHSHVSFRASPFGTIYSWSVFFLFEKSVWWGKSTCRILYIPGFMREISGFAYVHMRYRPAVPRSLAFWPCATTLASLAFRELILILLMSVDHILAPRSFQTHCSSCIIGLRLSTTQDRVPTLRFVVWGAIPRLAESPFAQPNWHDLLRSKRSRR
jgi:hypothetical protein